MASLETKLGINNNEVKKPAAPPAKAAPAAADDDEDIDLLVFTAISQRANHVNL